MRVGWIKFHRRFLEWGWYKDVNTKVVFIHLLLTANHTETEFEGVTIKPGQTVVGRKELAKATGLSEQSVRTAIKHLKSTNEITTWSTNRFTVVTIENWKKYQVDDVSDNQDDSQLVDQQLTSNQPATNHTIRIKEYKNDKNDYYSLRKETKSYPQVSWGNPDAFKHLAHDDEWRRQQNLETARILREIEEEFKDFNEQ